MIINMITIIIINILVILIKVIIIRVIIRTEELYCLITHIIIFINSIKIIVI